MNLFCLLHMHKWSMEMPSAFWTVYSCDRCGTRKWVAS